ncbi:TonB-dependent receptor [Blastomonas sp. UPD001]|uniref:TonB-dependent receptor n=1 Tax=Blastomonas sp. UPD001 TaxID=2217673 RepID=UPI000E34A6A9|nr:TonB-dependent receptor [Blastomonas sp. UPD001]
MVQLLRGTRHRALIESLSTGLSAIALTASLPAFAQTEPSPLAGQPAGTETAAQSQSDDTVGGDIVVTATRREQRTQSIGIAVSAYSGETLTRSGVLATTDLAAITPGLAITLVTPGQPALIAIRGISQSNYAGQLESTNAYYVDDNYQVLSSTNSQGLYDVARVETLKGPQGTLFGRNANGGLVNVITNDPVNEFSGYAQVGLASRGEVRAEGAVNLPISDTVAGRIAVYRNHFDGAYRNQVPNVRNLGDEDAFGIRGKIKIEANDRLTLDLRGSYYNQFAKSGGQALATPALPLSPEGLGVLTGPNTTTFFGYRDADGDPFTIAVDYPGFHGQKVWDAGFKVDYALSDTVTLIAQTYYQDAKTDYAEDNDLSPLNFSIYQVFNESKNFTQEVRLVESDGSFRWTAGAFYLRVRGEYIQNFELRGLGAITRSDYFLRTDSGSVFGQIEYDLSPQVTLIAGGRFIIDHKDFGIDYSCTTIPATFGSFATNPATAGCANTFASTDPLALINNPTYRDTHTERGFAGRAQINWQPIDDLLIYASYNRGYKAFNYNEAFAGATPIDRIRFDGERVNAFELGEKWDLLDRRLRINSALFYYDFESYQAFDQRGLLFTVFNSPARVYGGEVEVTVRPGGGWTLNGSALFLNTRVEDVPLPNVVTSRRTAQSPNWAYTFAVAKSFDLPIGQLEATFNGTYTGSQFAQLQNSPITLLPAALNANARIAFVPNGSSVQFALFSRNITNNNKPNYAFDLSGGALGFREQSFPDPRVIGAEIRVSF